MRLAAMVGRGRTAGGRALTGAVVGALAVGAALLALLSVATGQPSDPPNVRSDFDGDGVADLVIGRQAIARDDDETGRVTVHSGATMAPLLEVASDTQDDFFGFFCCAVEDVTGDGRDELLVGVPGAPSDPVERGEARLYDGATGEVVRTFSDPDTVRFGRAVADVGDQDGDGLADVAVSSFFTADTSAAYGAVQVFSTGDGALLKTIIGERVDDGFGFNLARTADVNGDGRPEIATVATRSNGQGGEGRGGLYVFHSGGAALVGAEEAELIGEDPGEGTGTFGWSVRPGEGEALVEVVSTRDDGGQMQYEVARWTAGGEAVVEPALALRTRTAGAAAAADALPAEAVPLRSWIPSLEGDVSHRAYMLESALFARAGDVSGDGAIDALDLGMVISNYGRSALRGAQSGDLDGDGAVTALDVRRLVRAMERGGDAREVAMTLVDSGDTPDCDDHQTGSIGESDFLFEVCVSEDDSEGDGAGNGPGSQGPGGTGGGTGGGGGPEGCQTGGLVLSAADAVLSGESIVVEAGIDGEICEEPATLMWSTPSGEALITSSSVSDDGMTLTLETDASAGAAGTIIVTCEFIDGDVEQSKTAAIDVLPCPQVTLEYESQYSILQQHTIRATVRPASVTGGVGSWNVPFGGDLLESSNSDDDRFEFTAGRGEGLVIITYEFDHSRCDDIQTSAAFNIAVIPGEDSDLDNVSDACEIAIGTDPGDSFSYPGDPTQEWADSDGDTLPDVQETMCLGTDPLSGDSDGDGWPDQCEVHDGYDPTDRHSYNPLDIDIDNDGIPDRGENCFGTDSTQYDTDHDGLTDYDELIIGIDATNPDDAHGDLDDDGLSNINEVMRGTDPRSADTDGDGTPDGAEVNQGSIPTDATDHGQPLAEAERLTLDLYISDPSGSNSETWGIEAPPLSIRAAAPGGPASGSHLFRRGQVIEAYIRHYGTIADSPDYDWHASISVMDNFRSSWIEIDDPHDLLGSHSNRDSFAGNIIIYLPLVDLDIDSNNNNGFGLPDRSRQEDDSESEPGGPDHPGKIVLAQTGDFDDDGVPDFADGIDTHGNSGGDSSHRFVPLVLDVSGFPEGELAVEFDYDASPPSAIELTADSFGAPAYLAAPGLLRVWTADGTTSRLSASISDGGDYVAAGSRHSLSQLGAGEPRTFYVEAVRPSSSIADGHIAVRVYLNDEFIAQDEVRVTALPRAVLAHRNTDDVRLLGLRFAPRYTDGLSAIDPSLAGSMSDDFTTLHVGADGPHPNAGTDASLDRHSIMLSVVTAPGAFLDFDLSPILITADENPDTFYFPSSSPARGAWRGESEDEGAWVDPDPGDLDPDGFEAEFEIALSDKYADADPSIEWLEREAFELRGLMYGGRSFEWFSARPVWRDGNQIFVEDSLSPEQAADAYYGYLLENYGPDIDQLSITPYLRYVGEIYNKLGIDRQEVGGFMSRHWGLVDQLATDYQGEMYTVGAGFAVGAALNLRRANQVRAVAGDMAQPAIPLIRRNSLRGKWVEYDTVVTSLGRQQYRQGPIQTAVENGSRIGVRPDGIYSDGILEVKDKLKISRTRQLRGEAWLVDQGPDHLDKNLVLVCTTRTKRVTGPVLRMIKRDTNKFLFRREVNSDQYFEWRFSNEDPPDLGVPETLSGEWEMVTKQRIQELLD